MVSKLRMFIVAAILCSFVAPLPVYSQEEPAGSANAQAAGEEQVNAGQPIAVSGTITSDYQLQGDDGVVYEIADTVAGNDVVQKVGAKVSIEGTVFEDGTYKVLVVESFRAK